MTTKEAYQYLYGQLATVYEEREARNITAIVFEDAFSGPQFASGSFSPEAEAQLKRVGERLAKQEPWQYVLGEADFYGLRFLSDKRALIPRPETEELVHQIIKDIRKIDQAGKGIKLLDIGTGTGCIPLTLKHHLRQLDTYGLDVSADALALAQANANKLELAITLLEIDILEEKKWDALPQFDVIISNPPYITAAERDDMRANVLQFEPDLALFVPNGQALLFYEAIARLGQSRLKTGGFLYFECNERFAKETAEMMRSLGYQEVILLEDIQGKERMARGRKLDDCLL